MVLLKRIYRNLSGRLEKLRKNKNNKISHPGAYLSNVQFDILGSDNTIEIHAGSVLKNLVFYIRGDRHRIVIQGKCRCSGNFWFEDHDGYLEIGEGTTIEEAHLAVTEPHSKITLGKDCMLAYGIEIRTGDSHSIIDMNSKQRINYARDVAIGDHVWIAAHALVLKGVEIGSHSVVGTGAVVTKAFKERNQLICGNPARVVKTNISWDRKRIPK